VVINTPVLVLNQSYEPLNLCRTRRALVLVFRGKAEVLENSRGDIRSVSQTFPLPSVIRLGYLVKRPRHQRKLTKHEVFNRDRYTCQYCGLQTKDLTIDHVVPRRMGGRHNWENVVSACKSCNRRKGGHTPEEAGMTLVREPKAPRSTGFHLPYRYLDTFMEWRKYVAGWSSVGAAGATARSTDPA
jgi:5-methylcytosine-specific restriction endonuclease McrA